MVAIDAVEARAYRVPTAGPEADATLCWDETGLVVVHVSAGGRRGLGWTYGDPAAAEVVRGALREVLLGRDALAVRARHRDLRGVLRNSGAVGIGALAISAIDVALWDLLAKVHEVPLWTLLGAVRDRVPLYASGGFVNEDGRHLRDWIAARVEEGFPAVKIKVGADRARDRARLAEARRALGDGVRLMADANGAFRAREALAFAELLAEHGVVWFEEPCDHRDLDGTRRVRERAPPGLDVAGGEYGWSSADLRAQAAVVDVLQADATRCGGVTGFLAVAGLCDALGLPLSAHTAPAIHLPLGCAAAPLVHLEWFHDHARIEAMLFDGVPRPDGGMLAPSEAPGLGVELKAADAERFAR